jgi:UDP-glucose 4-epimerase
MARKEMKIELTGGVNSGRGWKSDVKNMLLDISKIKKLGWKPKHNTKQAIMKVGRHSQLGLWPLR